MGTKTGAIEACYATLGKRLRFMREKRGWSLRDLGTHLDMHPSTLNSWEGGLVRIRISELLRYADALRVPPSVLLDGIPIASCAPLPELKTIRKESGRKRSATYAARKAAEANGKPT